MPKTQRIFQIIRTLSRLLLWCALAGAPFAEAVETGSAAADFTVTDAAGKPLNLASLRGKAVYVDFWASWCAPCRRSFPWMNAMQEKYAGSGLVILGVNVDKKREAADRFLAQTPAKFTIGYDAQGAVPALYAIKAMPSSVLIDAQGTVVFVHSGFRDEETGDLESRIRAALPKRPQ